MTGFIIGRVKGDHTKTIAYKIYFPEKKQAWLLGTVEMKRRYLVGKIPNIVGIKFQEEMIDSNKSKVSIVGGTGYYSIRRVDNLDGVGNPLEKDKEKLTWNVIGIKNFEEAREFICVNSLCEESTFNMEQAKELFRQDRINGICFDKNGALKILKKCNRQIYDY